MGAAPPHALLPLPPLPPPPPAVGHLRPMCNKCSTLPPSSAPHLGGSFLHPIEALGWEVTPGGLGGAKKCPHGRGHSCGWGAWMVWGRRPFWGGGGGRWLPPHSATEVVPRVCKPPPPFRPSPSPFQNPLPLQPAPIPTPPLFNPSCPFRPPPFNPPPIQTPPNPPISIPPSNAPPSRPPQPPHSNPPHSNPPPPIPPPHSISPMGHWGPTPPRRVGVSPHTWAHCPPPSPPLSTAPQLGCYHDLLTRPPPPPPLAQPQ